MKKFNVFILTVVLLISVFYGNIFGAGPTSITKTANPSVITMMFGAQQVTYTIAYENTTGSDISNYEIWDTLPYSYMYSSSTNGGVNSGSLVTWNLATLAAGASGTVQVMVNPFLSSGPVTSNIAMDSQGAVSTAIVNQPSPTFATTVTVTRTQTLTWVYGSPAVTATASLTIISTPTPASFFPTNIVVSGLPGNDEGRRSCTDGSGNIYIAGLEWDTACTCYVIYIYKYLPNGNLDLSFGTGGKMKCPGPDVHYAWNANICIKIDLSGRIVVGAYADPCGGTCADLVIYRCTAAGTPDLTFNSTGYKICHNTAWTGPSYGCAISFDSTGKICCTGMAWNGTDYDMLLIKCNEDGSTAWCCKYHPATGGACGNSVSCHGGKIYVAGYSDVYESSCTCTCREMFIWCYNEDGTPDLTFGAGGCCKYVNTALNHKHCVPKYITVTAGGKIVVTGEVDDGSGCDITCQSMVIWVYNSDGTPDTTFNTAGMVTDNNSGLGARGEQALVDTDGKIIVIGTRHNGTDKDICIWKYLADGTPDTTFGTGGSMIYNSGNDEEGLSILKIAICRLIAVGYTYTGVTDQYDQILWNIEDMCPAHTQTSTCTPTFTATPTSTLTVTKTVTATITQIVTPTVTCTATLTVSITSTKTLTATSTVTPTVTPTDTVTMTATCTQTATNTVTPTPTITPTAACGFAATPVFSVVMIFNPESSNDDIFQITSNTALASAPYLTVHPHGQSANKPALTFLSSLTPTETMKYRVLYPKQTGYGDVDYAEISYVDLCGNSATAQAQFEKSVISQKDVQLFKNVINPDLGERARIAFKIYGGGRITVKIYSRTGVLIKELYDSDVSGSGWKDAVWDGTNTKGEKAASGVYYAVVKSDFYTIKEKIAVVR